MSFYEIFAFLCDEGDVGAKSLLGEPVLDELCLSEIAMHTRGIIRYLLLLHQLGVWAIVHDVLAKDGRSQWRVDLLGIDVLDLSIQDKVVARRVQTHGHLAAEENKGKDIAILLLVSVARLWHHVGHTFLWFAKKKAYGSMPYVTVLPMMGSQ